MISCTCTCTCIRERKVGSIWDAEAYACQLASHACIPEQDIALIYPKLPMYRKPGTTKLAVGLSYLTNTLNDGRLIQIANAMHKSTLCMEGVNSCLSFHLNLQLTCTTGPHSWICICIADEKMQMEMRIQDHWACPNTYQEGCNMCLP
jgi:hypothetical protein